MTYNNFARALRRFRRRLGGNATVEFAIIAPLMFLILFMSVEIGIYHIYATMLDRAMDITVRDIRLGTGSDWEHDTIRDLICERSGFIDDCSNSLKLEMIQVDPFNWTEISSTVDCIDSSEDVDAVVFFENGDSNELMFLRACMTYDPVIPTWGLGDALADENGLIKISASSAFVQEPE